MTCVGVNSLINDPAGGTSRDTSGSEHERPVIAQAFPPSVEVHRGSLDRLSFKSGCRTQQRRANFDDQLVPGVDS
jgi:hypothetical protein